MSEANDYETQTPHSTLPKELEGHRYVGKYRYMDYDTELGLPLWSGFYVDTLSTGFVSPSDFNAKSDPFEDMKTRTMEKGDYLLCCPKKTGQHWTWEIMRMLIAGKAEYIPSGKETSWVDIECLDRIVEKYESPRVVCTHLALSWLPQGFRRADTKVVVTMRNLKDTFVSNLHHLAGTNTLRQNPNKSSASGAAFVPEGKPQADAWPLEFRRMMSSKYNYYGSHFDLYADIWDNHRDDPNVLLVFYEDLKRNPVQTIEKIANHMGVEHTPQLIAEIAEAVHFSKMKPGKQEVEDEETHEPTGHAEVIYRKGEIGDWKNTFTVAQNEEFDRKMAEWNRDRKIPFTYE